MAERKMKILSMGKFVIQMTFHSKKYLNQNFVYNLIQSFDLLEQGELRINRFHSTQYEENNLKEKLSTINCKAPYFEIISANKDIHFHLYSPLIIGFCDINICIENSLELIDDCIKKLFQLFGNDFYMIHVLEQENYEKQKLMTEKLDFLHDHKYKILVKIFPYYIYSDVGINIGLSKKMYFGKHILKYIDKNTLVHCPYVHSVQEQKDMVVIDLYHELNKSHKSIEKKVRKYLKIDEIAQQFIQDKYADKRYGQYFLKGYEQYHPSYFYWDYDENDHKQDNKYVIPLTDHDIVLRKYKNSYFEKVDEDFAAGEIIGFFMYRPLGEALALKKIEDLEAFIFVELFDISSCMEEYAKKHGYQIVQIDEHKYLFEKEDEKIIDRFYYFIPENEDHYKISLTIRKTLLSESTVKKVKSEYEKMIKSARLKRD